MAWRIAYSPCICCGIFFSYNPDRVPSTRAITGDREPVCETCMHRINERRRASGAEPFAILPGAYEPGEVD
jgi:hypothetical protein